MEKDTKYKDCQANKQAKLIETGSSVFYGARNRGLASWKKEGKVYEGESRKVLKDEDRERNLYEPIRKEVIQYVSDADIHWWHMAMESDREVTAHTLSSQVHCLNHLFAIRNDEAAIKAILRKATGMEFDEILPSLIPGDGLITFEFVFENKRLLNETQNTRGAKCTSVDALIYARRAAEKWLIPIEWKYTEAYAPSHAYNSFTRYIDMVSPASRLTSWHELYRQDPFYELGRQTLLMEKIIENEPQIAQHFFHLVIVPEGNEEMRQDAMRFQESLKEEAQSLFAVIDPQKLLEPVEEAYPALFQYLETRYWS